MNYLLDTNIFIQANKIQYPFDIFPGFWKWLERDIKNGLIHSIEPVYVELMKGNDNLKDWVDRYKYTDCFLKVEDINTQKAYREIVNWVSSPDLDYTDTAIREFLSAADSWLIAKAISTNSSIVTLERYDSKIKKRIKIPNVCKQFDVEYINTIALLREMDVKFKLA